MLPVGSRAGSNSNIVTATCSTLHDVLQVDDKRALMLVELKYVGRKPLESITNGLP